jgi:hypothetical protein
VPRVIAKRPAEVRTTKPRLSASESADVFGPFPLIVGEETANYETLFDQISEAVEPTDFIEEVFVRDFADLNWEVLRMRRLKGDLLTQRVHDEIRSLVARRSDGRVADELMQRVRSGDEKAVHEVEQFLAKLGLSRNSLTVRALTDNLNAMERIDYLLANAESRRNNALHEIQRHRLLLAERLRRAVQQIDAQAIQPPSDEMPDAAE